MQEVFNEGSSCICDCDKEKNEKFSNRGTGDVGHHANSNRRRRRAPIVRRSSEHLITAAIIGRGGLQ